MNKKLKIEVGKKYLTRDGGIVVIIDADHYDPDVPFLANIDDALTGWYRADGRYERLDLYYPHDYDLISEYAEPDPENK